VTRPRAGAPLEDDRHDDDAGPTDDTTDEARPGADGATDGTTPDATRGGAHGGPHGSGFDDPRVQAGVEHLQRAAHEVIAASRALLDVAEDLVDDPAAVPGILGLLGSVGDLVGRRPRPVPHAGRPDDDDPPVQRIPVS
jgi:hypothetical protein